MAKRPRQRAQVGTLGKHLTRRSRGRCELCESRDRPRPFELHPFPEEPDPERALMAGERCRQWLEAGRIDPIEAHFLETAVWAEVAPIRLAAARMLLSHNEANFDPWIQQALEVANVDPDTLEFRVGDWN